MLAHSGNFPVVPAGCRGGATVSQCSPSVVRAIAPLRPTSQQTASETTAPASQSSLDGLACEPHVFPASMERSMAPPFPARQRLEPDGAFNNEEKVRVERNAAKVSSVRSFACRAGGTVCATVLPGAAPTPPCRVAASLSREGALPVASAFNLLCRAFSGVVSNSVFASDWAAAGASIAACAFRSGGGGGGIAGGWISRPSGRLLN